MLPALDCPDVAQQQTLCATFHDAPDHVPVQLRVHPGREPAPLQRGFAGSTRTNEAGIWMAAPSGQDPPQVKDPHPDAGPADTRRVASSDLVAMLLDLLALTLQASALHVDVAARR